MPRAPLPTRPLGTSGLDITTVGFGAWAAAAAAGPSAGARRTTTSRSTPCAARSRSASTGSTPRRSTGSATPRRWWAACCATCPRPSGRYVFTKCGLVWNERDRMAAPVQTLAPDSIRRGVRGLAPPPRRRAHRSLPVPLARRRRHADRGSWAAMARLVDEGKVRAAGVSNFDVALLERCEAIRHVDSLQPPFSLIRREAARRRDPLVRGARHRRHLLQPDAVRPPDRSLRRRARGRPGAGRLAPAGAGLPARPCSSETSRCAMRCGRSRGGTGRPSSAVAVAWTLAWPGVTGAIVGARSARAGRRLDRAPRRSSSRPRTSTRSPRRSSARAPAPGRRGPAVVGARRA